MITFARVQPHTGRSSYINQSTVLSHIQVTVGRTNSKLHRPQIASVNHKQSSHRPGLSQQWG